MTERGKYIKTAFTLAEVLITLGIIGVVAAMTIPNLIMAQKAHRLRSQFLKSYSTVQQAFRQMEADDISLNPEDYPSRTMYTVFEKYLNGSLSNLPINMYKSLTGKPFNTWLFDDGQLLLLDGTRLMFENPSAAGVVLVSVDLNGYTTPPNRVGYDVFTFQFKDGELKTMGDTGTLYDNIEQYCNLSQSNGFNGVACAHRAKTETDYFKWVVKNVK